MVESDKFQFVLCQLTGDPFLGLIWSKIERYTKAQRTLLESTQTQLMNRQKEKDSLVMKKKLSLAKAVHIEVDESMVDRIAAVLAKVYNCTKVDSCHLGYSLYYVHSRRVEHCIVMMVHGCQGYLKYWTHQMALLVDSLYNER